MGMIGYAMRVRDDHDVEPPSSMVLREWREEADESGDEPVAISMEKLWQAIHFLVGGDAFDSDGGLGDLIMGGQDCGGQDCGDPDEGMTKRHSAERVAELHGMLSALSDETLRGRFDPADFSDNEVYPDIWDEDEDELWSELSDCLQELRRLLKAAAHHGEGLMVWVR